MFLDTSCFSSSHRWCCCFSLFDKTRPLGKTIKGRLVHRIGMLPEDLFSRWILTPKRRWISWTVKQLLNCFLVNHLLNCFLWYFFIVQLPSNQTLIFYFRKLRGVNGWLKLQLDYVRCYGFFTSNFTWNVWFTTFLQQLSIKFPVPPGLHGVQRGLLRDRAAGGEPGGAVC